MSHHHHIIASIMYVYTLYYTYICITQTQYTAYMKYVIILSQYIRSLFTDIQLEFILYTSTYVHTPYRLNGTL